MLVDVLGKDQPELTMFQAEHSARRCFQGLTRFWLVEIPVDSSTCLGFRRATLGVFGQDPGVAYSETCKLLLTGQATVAKEAGSEVLQDDYQDFEKPPKSPAEDWLQKV